MIYKIIMFLKNWRRWIIFFTIALTISACQMVTVDEPTESLSEEERDKNQIEVLVDAMALPNANVDNICRSLIEKYGEKAVPELSRNVQNRIPIVRLLSIFCLGQIYEKTHSEAIVELRPQFEAALTDPVPRIQFEAAATLCSMKDYQGVTLLIDALRDQSAYVRMVASQILFRTFQETFGYQYLDEAGRRDPAAQRWETWWRANKAQYMQKEAR